MDYAVLKVWRTTGWREAVVGEKVRRQQVIERENTVHSASDLQVQEQP
jgi:hypothetical protein